MQAAQASGQASAESDSLVAAYSVIGVFVRGADGGSGFLEPAVADSIEDLRDQLKGKKTLRVVEDSGAADVIVEILGRGWEATGSSTTEVKSTLNTDWSGKPVVEQSATSEADTAMVLRAQLIVGDYSLKMSGRHGARWKGAAVTPDAPAASRLSLVKDAASHMSVEGLGVASEVLEGLPSIEEEAEGCLTLSVGALPPLPEGLKRLDHEAGHRVKPRRGADFTGSMYRSVKRARIASAMALKLGG